MDRRPDRGEEVPLMAMKNIQTGGQAVPVSGTGKHKRSRLLWGGAAACLALSLCLPLSGCRRGEASSAPESQSSQTSPEPSPVETGEYPAEVFGREAESQPVRVVSLSPAVTELLCAFGYGDRLFGVSDACDYPEMVEGLTPCGTSLRPNMERIAEISPDYILTETPLQIEDYWQLADMDVDADIVEIAAPRNFGELFELYRDICILMDGTKTGRETGEMLADLYTQQLSVLQEKVSGDPMGDTLSAVFIIDAGGIMATGGTLYHEVLSVLGLENLEESGEDFAGTGGEKQPDLVLYAEGIPKESIKGSALFGEWEAVKEDRMIPVPMAPLERMSPRVFDMLDQLAKTIYTASWIGT